MSSSIFCVRCGYPNVQGQNFCPSCGAPVYVPPSVAPTPPVAGTPPLATPPPAYAAPPPYPYPAYPPPYGYGWYGPPPKRATVGRMVEDTFRVWGKDLLVYMAVYLAVGLLTTGATLLLTWLAFGTPGVTTTPSGTFGLPTWDLVGRVVLLVLTIALVSAIVGAIVVSTLTYFAVQRYRGAPEPLEQAFSHGLRRFLSVLGAQILLGVLLAAGISIPLAILLVGALSGDVGLILLGAFLILVLAIVYIYLYVGLSLYIPAIVMEGHGAVAGLRRSWDLTRGHRLDLFLGLIIIGALAGIISAAITTPFGLFNNPYVSAVGTILVSMIAGAWSLIFAGVAYQLISTEPPSYYAPPPYAPAPPMPPR